MTDLDYLRGHVLAALTDLPQDALDISDILRRDGIRHRGSDLIGCLDGLASEGACVREPIEKRAHYRLSGEG